MQNDYEKQATDLLASFGVDFRAVLVGNDCPPSCEDATKDKDMDLVDSYPRKSHIHGKHYRCTFSAKGRGHLAIDFWNSYHDAESNAFHHSKGELRISRESTDWDRHRGAKYPGLIRKPLSTPTPYDVITCIQKSEVGTFDDFCSDFGYDSDSRKAEETYHAVVREWCKVKKFFTEAELEKLQEVN